MPRSRTLAKRKISRYRSKSSRRMHGGNFEFRYQQSLHESQKAMNYIPDEKKYGLEEFLWQNVLLNAEKSVDNLYNGVNAQETFDKLQQVVKAVSDLLGDNLPRHWPAANPNQKISTNMDIESNYSSSSSKRSREYDDDDENYKKSRYGGKKHSSKYRK